MPEETTINIATMADDIKYLASKSRLLEDKVAALEKTRDALAAALTRTIQQAVEKSDTKLTRMMERTESHVESRITAIGQAIDARFGERLMAIEGNAAKFKSAKEDMLALAGTVQRNAEASAKSAAVADTFEKKLGMLDTTIKGVMSSLDATRATYLDEEDGKLLKARLDALEKKPATVKR